MWGRGLHFRTCNRKSGTAYLFYPQTPYKISVFETFHPNTTQNTTSIHTSTKPPFYVISPILTQSKITILTQKIPSTPWKIKLLSNSTENTIYNKEITLQNQLIYNSKITQNTSKINTFTQHKIYKQYNSIEVVFFIIKITSKF